MRRTPLVLATLVAVSAPSHAADPKLSLADLKQLVTDKAYEEALQHLDDIAPTQRNADWLAVGGTAAAGFVTPISTSDGAVLVVIDAIDRHYPQLAKATDYAKVRAERGTAGLTGCLEANGDSGEAQDLCMGMGQRLADGGDRALALAVAKIGTEHGTPAAIVPMWKKLASDASACKEADLASSVLGALDRPHDSALAGDGRAVMVTCWSQLEAAVVKQFDDTSKHSDFHKNTCDQLKAKQKLSSLQTKQCG